MRFNQKFWGIVEFGVVESTYWYTNLYQVLNNSFDIIILVIVFLL